MNCPICKTVNLAVYERQGIEIDYCPQCRGVWLDRGELDKIIDRSSGAVPSAEMGSHAHPYSGRPMDGHHDSRHGGYYNKKRKREGFLSDLFDFD